MSLGDGWCGVVYLPQSYAPPRTNPTTNHISRYTFYIILYNFLCYFCVLARLFTYFCTNKQTIMSKVQIKSIFEQISEIVFNTADLATAKQHTVEFVSSKNINDKDKQAILSSINECKTIQRFQFYIANALLKYEGLGTDRMANEYKPHR
jgi:hypothetical protein